MSHFLYFRKLNFISFRDAFVNVMGKRKVKKKYYMTNMHVPMLTIRYDHVINNFSDKFVLLCHVGYFINGDEWKLTFGYICHSFYTFGNKILYFHLWETYLLTNYAFKDNSLNYTLNKFCIFIFLWFTTEHWHQIKTIQNKKTLVHETFKRSYSTKCDTRMHGQLSMCLLLSLFWFYLSSLLALH